jgi:hypothetical protein
MRVAMTAQCRHDEENEGLTMTFRRARRMASGTLRRGARDLNCATFFV